MVPIIIIRDKVYVMREMLIHHCHHKFELMFNPPTKTVKIVSFTISSTVCPMVVSININNWKKYDWMQLVCAV